MNISCVHQSFQVVYPEVGGHGNVVLGGNIFNQIRFILGALTISWIFVINSDDSSSCDIMSSRLQYSSIFRDFIGFRLFILIKIVYVHFSMSLSLLTIQYVQHMFIYLSCYGRLN